MRVVRYVGKHGGMPQEYLAALEPAAGYAIVDSLPNGANVTLRLTLDTDTKPLEVRFDPLARDFLDLAMLVYIADELESRGDDWTRTFNVLFPVRNQGLWAANEQGLKQVLKTLAGDNYVFTWCDGPVLPSLGSHRHGLPRGFDAVCLFSGGIDSFLGAHRLLEEGKKLLLCGHQAEGTTAAVQKDLARALEALFPGRSRLIQCRIARSQAETHRFDLPDKCEETHRPRSFLFLGIAMALARVSSISMVYMPENGLIALNPPLGKNRLGTLSTRTAHPKYLTELSDFVHATGIFTGSIKNPFLLQSKTDMLRNLDPKLAQVMQRSVSCARPSRNHDKGVRHCGYCVPCIYRRVAMAEAGLDRSSDYAFKVFEELVNLDAAKQIDFKALVSFARRVKSATAVQREIIVLSHGFFPVTVADRFSNGTVTSHSAWAEMLYRWSEDFLLKIERMASVKTKRLVGAA